MEKIELENFYNDGFGWICRHCEHETVESVSQKHSRLMREGESESKQPTFSNKALAKWADAAKTSLICPHCNITELVEKR